MSSFVISADIKIEDEEQKEHVQNVCRQFSNMFRCAYNELNKGETKKDTEHKLYNYENIQTLDSWFIRCAVIKADGLFSANKKQFDSAMKSFEKSKDKNKIKPKMHIPIFGSRKKFKERAEGKITSEEWKQERIYMLESIGEENQGGNRKFELDIDNNQLIFKPERGIRIPIEFVGLRRTYIEKLKYIQENGKCFTVRLDDKRINITIDVENFVETSHKVLDQRVMGIDLNPDNIGYSITDQPSGKIIKAECFDLSNLTVKSGKPSESKVSCGEAEDPLGEDGHSPVPGLVHRYPDRVLLLAIDLCSNYCRYCTRSRLIGHKKVGFNKERLRVSLSYIKEHKEIRDVLVSGGDPLYLSDENLDWLLSEIRSIEHVEIVRIGSKMPAVLPQRITSGLLNVLKKYHPLWMSLHFAHPDECTPETIAACNRLADAGIPLGSQTVLLRGVNDDSGTMKLLMQKMLRMRVKPYYIYQCDPIIGTSHFRTPVSKGLEIMNSLRGHTTGYAVPTYVIDAPGGGGKIPISADNIIRREDSKLILRNFEGLEFAYPDN
jgi:KamA family protein